MSASMDASSRADAAFPTRRVTFESVGVLVGSFGFCNGEPAFPPPLVRVALRKSISATSAPSAVNVNTLNHSAPWLTSVPYATQVRSGMCECSTV